MKNAFEKFDAVEKVTYCITFLNFIKNLEKNRDKFKMKKKKKTLKLIYICI